MPNLKTTEELQDEINSLKETVKEQEVVIQKLEGNSSTGKTTDHSLSNEEISRYSRQMFVDLIKVKGQEKLKKSSVLVVGCGGLGCPSTQYLAGVGIGRLGLVDYDDVELNNLHRQVLHSEDLLGTSKVESLALAVKRLNSNVVVEKHKVQLSSSNALSIVERYDVVIDATDNVATRYLLNDACILTHKPLISGAAVKTEGQLTVYSYNGGPCYRCLFPNPPPAQSVANCGDVGVLPPVPGVIGVLQALQAVHIILGNIDGVLSKRMLLFDSELTEFRSIKLRGRSEQCAACGSQPSIKTLIDYEQFCGSPANDKMRGVTILEAKERATVSELKEALSNPQTVLIDVRSETEFEMCRIPGSVNIPLEKVEKDSRLSTLLESNPNSKAYVICRRGNDSQIAVIRLRKNQPQATFLDIIGGLHSWSKKIDQSFPVY